MCTVFLANNLSKFIRDSRHYIFTQTIHTNLILCVCSVRQAISVKSKFKSCHTEAEHVGKTYCQNAIS